jgi:hypothetical protein
MFSNKANAQPRQAAVKLVYDGRELIGVIIKCDGHYDAFARDGRCVGSFQNRTDAMRAVPRLANAAKSNKEKIARQYAH